MPDRQRLEVLGVFSLYAAAFAAAVGGWLFVQQFSTERPAGLHAPTGDVVALYEEGAFVASGSVVASSHNRVTILANAHSTAADSSSLGRFVVARQDSTLDLALLYVYGADAKPFKTSTRLGPRFRIASFFEGEPILVGGEVVNRSLGWVDAKFLAGMSGGAVINEDGELVGLVKESIDGDGEWLGVIVLPSEIESFLALP